MWGEGVSGDCLADHGGAAQVEYEIVQKHGSFQDQVKAMSRAGVLMLAHGAAATNTIFQPHRYPAPCLYKYAVCLLTSLFAHLCCVKVGPH